MKSKIILFVVCFKILITPISAQFVQLHDLTGGVDDGREPEGSLISDGTFLYGMTKKDGDTNDGIIFSIELDGDNYTVLHEFLAVNGQEPKGSLISDGTHLYGMTSKGGSVDLGIIFSIEPDGDNYTVLHEFSGGVDDGREPEGSLISDGTFLCGMTKKGGDTDDGIIFSVELDGDNYTILHEFSELVNGEEPKGSLVRHETHLYGMTSRGILLDQGVIFMIEANGDDFTILHEFTGGTNGGEPWGSFTIHDHSLYGMTKKGGDGNDLGGIFRFGDSSLPVELSSFTVEAVDQGALCKWTTESETENLGFILERKTEGDDWIEITSYKTDDGLLGQGSISSATDYEYLDKFVESNTTYAYRLADVDYNGVVVYHATRTVAVDQIKHSSLSEAFTVLPAYPNPFNPSTTIRYGIDNDSKVTIAIYDITGNLVSTLINTVQSTGWHTVIWNGTNKQGSQVPAGIYLSRIATGSEVKTAKLMLLK